MASAHDETIRYGLHDGQLRHISEVEQGLACDCRCLECREPLMAKKGPVLAHHFSHTGETNCNPSPEKLTHRYAKELIAQRLIAIEPAFEIRQEVSGLEAWWRQPAGLFKADRAIVEPTDYEEFKPDVMLVRGAMKFAIEVYFRHPVPPAKAALLEKRYLHVVEVDLSDLDENAGPEVIGRALDQHRRWKWLSNRSPCIHELKNQLDTCSKLYVPKLEQLKERKAPKSASPQLPHNKIREAATKLTAVNSWLARPKETRKPYADLDQAEKLALHCVYLGISPLELPIQLMQNVRGQSLLGKVHGLYWQTWLFAKFCVGTRPIDIRKIEEAARQAFPDLRSMRGTLESTNGFSATTELFYEFLMQLALQGLIIQQQGSKPWLNTFAPKVRTPEEARALLTKFPAAGDAS